MSTSETAAPRKVRGPYAKSAKTRKNILEAALEVFAESGYRSGSLREVAARVEISEAGLLHHFSSKSALLAGVLEYRDAQTRELFDFSVGDGRGALRNLVSLARYNADLPGVVQLFCTLSAEATSVDHPAYGYFRQRYRDTVGRATTSLRVIQETGGLLPGVEPRRAAQRAIALWDGLQIQWLLDRESLDVAEQLTIFFDSLLTEPL